MGLKYTKRAMTSYEVHRFFHGLEISFFPDTFFGYYPTVLLILKILLKTPLERPGVL